MNLGLHLFSPELVHDSRSRKFKIQNENLFSNNNLNPVSFCLKEGNFYAKVLFIYFHFILR